MSDTKQQFYKTLNTIVGTNRIDNEEAYIINDYISRLEATIKNEQLEINKQKEVLDKIKETLRNAPNKEDDYDYINLQYEIYKLLGEIDK